MLSVVIRHNGNALDMLASEASAITSLMYTTV